MEKRDLRQIAVSAAAYSLSSILGPLLVLGVPAYFIDTWLGTRPVIMLVAVFIAFITTNILLYKKISQINHLIATKFPKVEKKTESSNTDNQEGASDQIKS